MAHRFRVGLLIILSLTAVWTEASAQVTSSRLKGVVRDESRNEVRRAKVSVFYPSNRMRLEVSTDEEGLFIFPSLPPGEFTLTVEAKSYQTIVYNNVILGINQTMDVVLSMQTSAAAGAAAGNPQIKNVEDLNPLPDYMLSRTLIGRELELLPKLDLIPINFGAFQTGVETQGGSPGLSRVNGTRQGSNNLTLDGTDVNDPVAPSFGLSLAAVNVDSVDQFRVITAGARAEYSTRAGGQMIMVTRTGGGRWTGSAYDYFENSFLNANEFFNNAPNSQTPKDNQNIFGFSGGGPLIANRTFVFGNYEGTRFNKEILRNRTVLTSNAKSGLFTWYPRVSNATQTPNTYNIVSSDPRKLGIDPQVAKTLSMLPDPNNKDLGDGLNTAGYRFNNPIDGREDQFTIRVDHNLASNHRLFYRQSWSRDNQSDWQDNADATFPGQASGRKKGSQWGFVVGSDLAISARKVNEFRLSIQSASTSFLRPARLSGPMMISGLWTDPLNPDYPSSRESRIYEASDNFSFSRWGHTIKAGGNVRLTTQRSSSSANVFSDVTFGTSAGNVPPSSIGPGATTLTSDQQQTLELLYNALLGRMEKVSRTFYSDAYTFQPADTPRDRDFRFQDYGVFVQDDWKLRKDLNLSLGARYEVNPGPTESNDLLGILDQEPFVSSHTQISNFTLQPGVKWYRADVNIRNIGPRVGFAWSPRGNRTLTIRGGGGLFYERPVGATAEFVDVNTPGFSQTVTVFPNQSVSDVRLSDGIPLPQQPSAPVQTMPSTRSATAAFFDQKLRNGYVEEVNLTVQKQLFHDTIIEASYASTRGKRLFMNLNFNQLKASGSFLQAFKEIVAFRNNFQPVSPSNVLVRLFGSVNGAVNALGGRAFDMGLAGAVANTVDTTYYTRYSAAGLSDFYLRNYPQFDQLIVGSNAGLSYYDSGQVRVRHRTNTLNVDAAYTFSKSLDNISTDGGSYTSPIDSFNLILNKGRSDADRPHVFSVAATYALPTPKKTWLRDAPEWFRQLLTGWNIGLLSLWESGLPFTVSSGRQTANAGVDSLADYTGSRNTGTVIRSTNGVFYFYKEQIQNFSFPAAGEIGDSGRNTFRGPNYFTIDTSLTKDVRLKGAQKIVFRIDGFNVFNNANFALPVANLSSPTTFGLINSTVGNPRMFRVAVRFSF